MPTLTHAAGLNRAESAAQPVPESPAGLLQLLFFYPSDVWAFDFKRVREAPFKIKEKMRKQFSSSPVAMTWRKQQVKFPSLCLSQGGSVILGFIFP